MSDLVLNTVDNYAKRVIAQLSEAQRKQAADHQAANVARDEKLADLKAAVKTLSEAANRSNENGPGTAAVRDFIHTREDGGESIRWKSGTDDMGDWVPGLLDTPTDDAWVTKMQALTEQRTLVRAMTKGIDHRTGQGVSPKTDRDIARHLSRAPAPIKRLFSDSTSTGGEFIPDLLSPALERELRAARRVEAIFPEWSMAGKELRIPFLSTELRPYVKTAITGDDPAQYTSSTIVSAQRSITAKGLAVRTQLDEDTTEDSVIEGLPLHRNLLIEALTDGCEDAILNGDTTASHQDTISAWNPRSRWGASGLGGSADHRRAWLGLRAYAADNSSTTDGASAQTLAGLLTSRASLDSPHGVDGSLAMIVSPEYYLVKMLGWAEVLTLDKFGANFTALTGQVAGVLGMPVIISEFMDKQLNASGVFDNVTLTKTGYLVVNRMRWYMGARRSAMVEVDKDITRGVINAVSTVRKTFFSVDSTKKNVNFTYNLSVS